MSLASQKATSKVHALGFLHFTVKRTALGNFSPNSKYSGTKKAFTTLFLHAVDLKLEERDGVTYAHTITNVCPSINYSFSRDLQIGYV